jgi:replicative DNA helicase
MYSNGATVDICTITLLKPMEQHAVYIAEIAAEIISINGLDELVDQLIEYYQKRRCYEFAKLLAENCDNTTASEMKEKIETFALDFHDGKDGGGLVHISDAMRMTAQRYQDAITNGTKILTTGFKNVDDLLYGFEPGKLYVLGARPAAGKSALMLDMAKKCGGKAVIFSTEMDLGELSDRMVSAASGLPLRTMKHRESIERNQIALVSGMETVSKYQIYIDDTPFKTVEQIVSDIRFLKIKDGVDIVFIDYLQYLQVPESQKGRRLEEINHISMALKRAAKILQVPIVALASLHRFENGVERRPRREDLRESGQIESDAHGVMLLYRDPASKHNDPEIIELIVDKHRGGPEGVAMLDFHKAVCRFEEAAF